MINNNPFFAFKNIFSNQDSTFFYASLNNTVPYIYSYNRTLNSWHVNSIISSNNAPSSKGFKLTNDLYWYRGIQGDILEFNLITNSISIHTNLGTSYNFFEANNKYYFFKDKLGFNSIFKFNYFNKSITDKNQMFPLSELNLLTDNPPYLKQIFTVNNTTVYANSNGQIFKILP
jgi:hypothetical protein